MSTTSQTKRMPSLGLRKPQRVDGGDAGGVPGVGVVLVGGDSSLAVVTQSLQVTVLTILMHKTARVTRVPSKGC